MDLGDINKFSLDSYAVIFLFTFFFVTIIGLKVVVLLVFIAVLCERLKSCWMLLASYCCLNVSLLSRDYITCLGESYDFYLLWTLWLMLLEEPIKSYLIFSSSNLRWSNSLLSRFLSCSKLYINYEKKLFWEVSSITFHSFCIWLIAYLCISANLCSSNLFRMLL